MKGMVLNVTWLLLDNWDHWGTIVYTGGNGKTLTWKGMKKVGVITTRVEDKARHRALRQRQTPHFGKNGAVSSLWRIAYIPPRSIGFVTGITPQHHSLAAVHINSYSLGTCMLCIRACPYVSVPIQTSLLSCISKLLVWETGYSPFTTRSRIAFFAETLDFFTICHTASCKSLRRSKNTIVSTWSNRLYTLEVQFNDFQIKKFLHYQITSQLI